MSVLGVERKRSVHSQPDVNDPIATFEGLGASELSCKIAYSTGRSGLIHCFGELKWRAKPKRQH